jgi:hypothetical protein
VSGGLRRAARAADPFAVDDHDSTEPARPRAAKVRQRWVGTATAQVTGPSPAPHYEPDRSWDKLLLLIGAVVIAAALLVVPGILNRGGHNPVAAAAEATSDSPGVLVTFSGRFQGPAQVTISGRGALNGETDQAQIEISMAGTTIVGTQGMRMDEIVDDGDLYLRSPQLSEALGNTSGWLLMRSEVFGDLLQGDAGGAGMSGSPTRQLDALKDASYEVVERGQERVDGVMTTHYSALLDLDKIADQLKSEVSGDFADAIERETQQVSAASVDVWIDGDGLLRREVSNSTMGSMGAFVMTMDFSHYGVRPQIRVPRQSEVTDVTSLMQQALDQAGG